MNNSAYCSLEELKAAVDKKEPDDDAVIAVCINVASDWINRTTNRPDGYAPPEEPTVRFYAGTGQTVQYIDQCIEITEVAVKRSAPDTDYQVWADDAWFSFLGEASWPNLNMLPYNGIMTTAGNGYIFTESRFGNTMRGFNDWRWSPSAYRRVPTVRVTAKFCYSDAVPAVIKQACIIEASRLYKMGRSFYADALASAELGKLIMMGDVHPMTKQLLFNGGMKRIPI